MYLPGLGTTVRIRLTFPRPGTLPPGLSGKFFFGIYFFPFSSRASSCFRKAS
jgi:hypothetical protein